MKKKQQPIRTSADLQRLGTILFVGAHPDDESYCAGATLAAAALNGQRVVCVTATRGEKGVQDESRWPAAQLGKIREVELSAALSELGVAEHYWFDYKDGECQGVSQEEAARRITALIERCNIDTVLTFGPDGLTGHPDHQTVSQWTAAAVHASSRKPQVYHIAQLRTSYEKYRKRFDQLDVFFNIKNPPLVDEPGCAICLEPEAKSIEQKYRALKAMPSQMEKTLAVIGPENFVGALGHEAFVRAKTVRRR